MSLLVRPTHEATWVLCIPLSLWGWVQGPLAKPRDTLLLGGPWQVHWADSPQMSLQHLSYRMCKLHNHPS